MNKHLVPVTPFGEPSRAETRGQGLDADQPPRTPVPKRNASHRASHRKGLQPPHLRELDPPDLRFLTPWRWSSLRRSSSPHPPSALSATSLPPGLLHLGLRHHHPLCHQLSSGTREILGQAPPLLAMVPWAPAGCSQALPPPRSRREARPVMLFLPPSLLPFAVSLSRPSSASCLESSPQNSLHFRRWPPLENTDPRAPHGVVRPRSQGPSCCPFCAHRAPCWTLSTLQGTLLGAPRRCREPCATGIGAL